VEQNVDELFRRAFPDLAQNDTVRIGRALPVDVPDLALSVAEEWAETYALPRYADFLRQHNEPPKTKPVKPTADALDDHIRRNPPPVNSERERRFFRLALERDELALYFDKLREYELYTAEQERFRADNPPNAGGYIKFLCKKDEKLSRFFFDCYRTLPITESERKRHTYIVGGSGSGKTELVKYFLFHYLTRNTGTAVILIEPHGQISRQVARWRELADGKRLVYIRPGMSTEYTPVFNPFDIPDDERSNPKTLAILVDDTIDVVEELLERDFTLNMETLMRACLTILYSRPGSSFNDVLRFVDVGNNTDLIELAARIFPPGSPLLSFVYNDLPSDALKPTRQAVKMRFTSLLSRYSFSSFLIGKSTFNLEELIKRRAFVIFNFSASDVGVTESRIFGKLILTHIKAFGFKQGRDEAPSASMVPVHVFIDECQEFITPSLAVILEQLRKFGIHLTLVQQGIGKDMDKRLTSAVLTNTAVKATGRNSDDNLRRFAAETGADPQELGKLKGGKGWFCISAGGRPPFRVKIPGHRVDERGATGADVWKATLSDQIARFYAPRTHTRAEPPETRQALTKLGQKGFSGKELAAAPNALLFPIDD